MKAYIYFRKRGFLTTEIDDLHDAESLARRMSGGGFVIAHDAIWGRERTIPINLADVSFIVLESERSEQ